MKDYVEVRRINRVDFESDKIEVIDKQTKKVLLQWNDNAHIDYPEDLSWSRMIGELFRDAFKIGFDYGKQQIKELEKEKNDG